MVPRPKAVKKIKKYNFLKWNFHVTEVYVFMQVEAFQNSQKVTDSSNPQEEAAMAMIILRSLASSHRSCHRTGFQLHDVLLLFKDCQTLTFTYFILVHLVQLATTSGPCEVCHVIINETIIFFGFVCLYINQV